MIELIRARDERRFTTRYILKDINPGDLVYYVYYDIPDSLLGAISVDPVSYMRGAMLSMCGEWLRTREEAYAVLIFKDRNPEIIRLPDVIKTRAQLREATDKLYEEAANATREA